MDYTDALETFARDTAAGLHGLAGYVLMKSSPSCGMERVKVYSRQKDGSVGMPKRVGRGIFAEGLSAALPNGNAVNLAGLNENTPFEPAAALTRLHNVHAARSWSKTTSMPT